MRSPLAWLGLVACALLFGSGCGSLRGIAYLAAPPQIQKAEFTLSSGSVAVLIDYARPGQVNPVFDVGLHERIVEAFRDNKVSAQIVPHERVTRLRQSNQDFESWSLQRIGRELGAEQVLHIRIERLLLAEPDDPVVSPSVELHFKVIAVAAPAVHARLWPPADAEPDGRTVTHNRHPVETGAPDVIDGEARKLARETGVYVARHFHKYDLEGSLPREP
jgi:hypothetical protein